MLEKPDHKNTRFAFAFAQSVKRKIEDGVATVRTRQTGKLTDINLKASLETAVELIIADPPYSSWPANKVFPIRVSAHNRTEWLREESLALRRADAISIEVCRIQPLDLQIRQGKLLILNVETELGGGKARKEDHKKLTTHSETPTISMFLCQEKSFKNVDRTFVSLQGASKSRSEIFINIIQHWPKNTTLDTSVTYVKITRNERLLLKLEPVSVTSEPANSNNLRGTRAIGLKE